MILAAAAAADNMKWERIRYQFVASRFPRWIAATDKTRGSDSHVKEHQSH